MKNFSLSERARLQFRAGKLQRAEPCLVYRHQYDCPIRCSRPSHAGLWGRDEFGTGARAQLRIEGSFLAAAYCWVSESFGDIVPCRPAFCVSRLFVRPFEFAVTIEIE